MRFLLGLPYFNISQLNMNKVLKYKLLLLFSLVTIVANSQILLPSFEIPKRLETLNTESEEIAPVPFSNGQKLYFVRATPEGNAEERKAGQEIWTSERTGDSWSKPENVFKEANDLGNNGVIGSSADGNKIYVFNSIQSRRKLARGIAYVEKQDDGTWSDLKKLKIDGFKIGDGYYSFYMNKAEDVLLISMAPNKNTINEDLFVSTKDSLGKWTEIKTLGAKINTSEVELSPFITEDKNALYFASNGHGGEGDVDIFISYRIGDGWEDWTTPKNLGPQINSNAFDAYFMIGNIKEVFFVSNRDSARGDLYTTKLVEAKSVQLASNNIVGQFLYKGLPVDNITLKVYDELGNLVDTVITDEAGKFTYRKLNFEENYFLKVAEEDASNFPNAIFYELDQNGKKSRRFLLTKTGHFVPASQIKGNEIIVGSFSYNNLPLENTYVLVLNDEGVVVDTIITNATGSFIYKKLDANTDYTFSPLDIDNSELVLIDVTDPRLTLNGNFTYNNLPFQNRALLVLDENGDVVDTIYTDKKGNFNYTKLGADNSYSFIPAELEGDDFAYDFTLSEPNETEIGGTMKYKNLPLINMPLLVKDENGVVIDTIYTDINGKFNFKKLKADGKYSFEALEQENDPSLLDFSLTEIEKEQIQGIFKYKNLPQANSTLLVFDAEGVVIDTLYTDANGAFSYKKLKGDKVYSIKPLIEENYDLDMLDIYSTNKAGLKKVHYSMDGLANENLEDDLVIIDGIFKYNNLPQANSTLLIFDAEGTVIDTIYTDANGAFTYNKLKGDKAYSIKPLNEEDFDLDMLDIYSTNKAGLKKVHYSTDELANERLEDDLGLIDGIFKYNNIPQAYTPLLIFDADGVVIDTVYTDAYGVFTHNKLKGDNAYSIKPLKEEDFDLANIDFGDGELIESKEASINDEGKIDLELFKEFIKFQFETSNRASSTIDSSLALKKIATYFVNNPNKKIRLKGHTCNMGSEEVNRMYSLQRAYTVKDYLLSKGVKESQMEVKAMLDTQPLVPNSSILNRQKNRRVTFEMIN